MSSGEMRVNPTQINFQAIVFFASFFVWFLLRRPKQPISCSFRTISMDLDRGTSVELPVESGAKVSSEITSGSGFRDAECS
jgi:hypothetical protein